jgi:adenylate kinase
VRVAVAGTPGTGKTTATDLLDTEFEVIHLNDVIREQDLTTGHDDDRDSAIADVAAVEEWLGGREEVVFESHLAHQFPADRVVVLRCHPETLDQRLRERGESAESAAENAESEALDVILAEAVDTHGEGSVYEIDATEQSPEEVAAAIQAVIDGERDPQAGTVSFIDYL